MTLRSTICYRMRIRFCEQLEPMTNIPERNQKQQDKIIKIKSIHNIITDNIIIPNMTFRFSQVAVCKNSAVELIDLAHPTELVFKGDLQLLIEVSTGMLLFKLDDFTYGVNPNDKIVYEDKDANYRLLLCLDSSQDMCWILKINENVQLVQFVVSERCKLIHRRASKLIVQQISAAQGKPIIKQEEPIVTANYQKVRDLQMIDKKQNEPNQNQMSSSMLLVQASKSLSKGIAKAGEFLAKGLEKLGQFFATKVKPEEQITISPQTKKLLKDSADGSKKILEITTEQFSAFFRIAKGEAQKLVDKFEKSQKGRQMIEKNDYNSYKKKLLTGVHIIANIYEGIAEGIGHAGTGLAKGTTQVVEAKYGKDAGEATGNIIEGARNVYKITESPYTVAKKQFKPTEAMIKKL